MKHNIPQTHLETSQPPPQYSDTVNSPLVKDQWQSEETTTRSKHSTMYNQNKEAQILCSEACNGQYQRYCFIRRKQ